MMHKNTFVGCCLALAFMIAFLSCSRKAAPASSETGTSGQISIPGPPCIIYKTKADFSELVPVELNADRSGIASYPDVADIYRQGTLAYPTPLLDSFLLDNRGIGPNVAFLKLSYEEYRGLDETPAAAELWNAILEADPLLEMYRCGNRSQYKDLLQELNDLIRSDELSRCERLK